MHFDAKNLYGLTMNQLLPVAEFQWGKSMAGSERWTSIDSSVTSLPPVVKSTDDILATPDNADYGYFVKVDMEYHEQLHDAQNDYPLAPETILYLNQCSMNINIIW